MKKLFLVFLLLQNLAVHSQVPGYLGKKTQAGYGFNLSPAFTGATPGKYKINFVHELYIDRAVAAKWLIGFGLRFYNTIYDNRAILDEHGVRPEDSYKIRGTTLCLNFKYFKQNYIAPWGRYFMMGPVLHLVRTSYDPYMHVKGRVLNHDTLYVDFGPAVQAFTHVDFMFGWGKTRIIADKFTIDYGINFQLIALFSVLGDLDFSTISLRQRNYIEETHKTRVNGLNRFNAFLKVGYLF